MTLGIVLLFIALFFIFIALASKKAPYQGRASFSDTMKGKSAERRLVTRLNLFKADGARFIPNAYLPCGFNRTTEVDMIMMDRSGVFVFECKHRTGWIFGDEYSDKWCETIKPSYQPVQKFYFYNPVKQNATHIRVLMDIANITKVPVYNIVVLDGPCEIRRMNTPSPHVFVITADYLGKLMKRLHAESYVQQEYVDRLYSRLAPYAQVSPEVKEQHIRDVESRH